jgi:hypothetical protein
VPLPSYLQRRNGGRYHFQMRLGAALVSCLGWSHLRCALRTADSREARRRMMDTLDWAFEFRDARDLDAAGEALTRKLESFVEAGPPNTARELTGRQTFEAIVAAFIARAREREFAFARIPGFVDLFKAFTAQNIRTEDAATASLGKTRESTLEPIRARSVVPTALDVDGLFSRLEARLDRLDESLARVQAPPSASEAFAPTEDIWLSAAVGRFLATEVERRGDRKSEATLKPILEFLVAFLGDRRLSEVSREDLGRVDAALPEIPHLAGCSLSLRSDLHARYLQARAAPWEKMRRNSVTTLRLRYQRPLRIFFEWLVEQKLYPGPAPKFEGTSDEMFAVMPRDKFESDEVLRFVSASLFTG